MPVPQGVITMSLNDGGACAAGVRAKGYMVVRNSSSPPFIFLVRAMVNIS